MNTRELILDILLEWEQGNIFSHLLLQSVLEKYDYLDGRDKAFIKKTVQGTIEQLIYIDYVLNQFSKVPVNKMKRVIRGILRMSVYQLLFLDSVPDSAVCNEAVKLANKRKFQSLKGFVNGVLRQIARNRDQIVLPDREKDLEGYLSVRYSMPPFLTKHFLKNYGEDAETILAAFVDSNPVTIRFAKKVSEEERNSLTKSWEEKGVVVEPHPYLTYARQLKKTEGVAALDGYDEGLFTVQDLSSMLVGEVAGIKEGMTVVDVCAAPGGKTMHAAEMAGNTGLVKAYDVVPTKLERMQDNVDRMGLDNVTLDLQDATEFLEDLEECADVLLADVPCSGLGVIGKKQDIKYRIDEKALQEIVKLQKQILNNVWKYVKKNGVMIFSTCTMNPEENEKMVQWVEEHLPFSREGIEPYLSDELKESCVNGTLQLKPGVHKTDGFFIARLRRVDG